LKKSLFAGRPTTPMPPFQPAPWLRHPYVQTYLGTSFLRVPLRNRMLAEAREMVLDAGGGARLQGFYSAQKSRPASGLAILLHGWQGSADSPYMLSTGRALYRHGLDVLRLNLRDHGESLHLNEGLFHALRLEEVCRAVKQAARGASGLPVFLVGFSLGGNFALRIGLRCLEEPLDGLRRLVAVSPVIDPAKSTARVDRSTLVRRHFLTKWRSSLKKKQRVFPQLRGIEDLLRGKSVREMTAALVRHYTDHDSVDDYFRGYTLTGGALKPLALPALLITSRDDPIIPAEDFDSLETSPSTKVLIHRFGGHNGFVEGLFRETWYEQAMAELFG
jgi:uncharacterized protein